MGIPIKVKRIIKEGLHDLYYYNLSVMVARMYCTIVDESLDGVKRKNKAILDYLHKKYGYIIQRYQKNEEIAVQSVNAPIWVFWWDGEENMPDVIKMCYQSKLRTSGSHPVILLTHENINNYIEFPEYVWNQFYNKKLRIQHLADMIRVQLIRRYGGLWLDASVYCAKDIPEEIFELPLYSMRGEIDEKYVSKNQWTTFVIGGWKNNVLCSFLDDFFIEYCKTDKPFIDYFMFDCAIALAYAELPLIKNQIDNLPKTQGDCYWINSKLEEIMTEQIYNDLIRQNVIFYKIAWNKWINSANNSETFYSYLLRKEKINERKS